VLPKLRFVALAVTLVAASLAATASAPASSAATLTEKLHARRALTGAFTKGTVEAYSTVAVGDVTGDGRPDAVVGGPDGHVAVWGMDGSLELDKNTGAGAVHASPALVDLDGDGRLDILVANTGGVLMAFTGSGADLFWAHDDCSQPLCGVFATPTVADLDRDGRLDVVATSWDHQVHAWRLDGYELPGFPRFLFDTQWSSPAVADIDGDGWTEVVFFGDMGDYPTAPYPPGALLWIIRHDGSVQPGFPRSVPGVPIWSSPAVVDLDGDGSLDIVAGTGTDALNYGSAAGKRVHAFDRYGNELRGWPVATNAQIMASPAVGDIDGDGRPDVVTIGEDGLVNAHRADGSLLWTSCNMSNQPPASACHQIYGTHGSAVIADVDGDGRQDVVADTEKAMHVLDGRTGVITASAPLDNRALPAAAAATVASIDGKATIFQHVVEDSNGNGRTDAGDSDTVVSWTAGNAAGVAWPTFKQNNLRTGTVFDLSPPQASVDPLAATSSSTRFNVAWRGTDVGSGVASYDIQVSDGGGPWLAWQSRTPATIRAFYGFSGHTYGFRIRATDRAGNVGDWSPTVSGAVAANATRAQPFRAGYSLSRTGDLGGVSSPPQGFDRWGWNAGRDAVALPGTAGGYVLDLYGGVHPYGRAPKLSTQAYWPNWDIARGIALNADGKGGYVLDGYGGLHAIGNAVSVTTRHYWPNWDIAVDLTLLPSSTATNPAGYVLDGWGGLHPFGSAPAVTTPAYWPGWNIARAVAANPDGPGGWVLDGFGGLHRFGGAPVLATTAYWSGWDIACDLTVVDLGGKPAGWVLDGWGGVHPVGGAPGVQADRVWPFRDNAIALAVAP
jgi:hypothetical protein